MDKTVLDSKAGELQAKVFRQIETGMKLVLGLS